jgi:hypothetical protein
LTAKQFGIKLETREPVYAAVAVIDQGAKGYANDVAILRINMVMGDSLICLPLASPEKIKRSAEVLSLGFPGFRYDEAKMNAFQLSTVNVESGKIDWTPASGPLDFRQLAKKTMMGLSDKDDELLFVSAVIRPGSSGGPLILTSGEVAGLNVAYGIQMAPKIDERTALGRLGIKGGPMIVNIATPIDAAKRLLEKNKIVINAGETTKLWHEGLKLFDKGMFDEAKAQFEKVAKRQVMLEIEKPTARTKPAVHIVSHYVKEMIERCDRAAK